MVPWAFQRMQKARVYTPRLLELHPAARPSDSARVQEILREMQATQERLMDEETSSKSMTPSRISGERLRSSAEVSWIGGEVLTGRRRAAWHRAGCGGDRCHARQSPASAVGPRV